MTEQNSESRFKKRLMKRMTSQTGEHPPLNDRDEAAMAKFKTSVEEMIDLLREETVALENGEVEKIEPLFQRKQDIFSRLQIHEPIVEPILKSRPDEFSDFREQMVELNALVSANGVMIERISAATSAVSREVKRIQKRHSLDGLYAKTGRKVADTTTGRRRYDEKM